MEIFKPHNFHEKFEKKFFLEMGPGAGFGSLKKKNSAW
jgi:hypothetical protein